MAEEVFPIRSITRAQLRAKGACARGVMRFAEVGGFDKWARAFSVPISQSWADKAAIGLFSGDIYWLQFNMLPVCAQEVLNDILHSNHFEEKAFPLLRALPAPFNVYKLRLFACLYNRTNETGWL